MGVINNIKRWITMIFQSKAESEFQIKPITTEEMSQFINKCADIYKGYPWWKSKDIKTVNFARSVCEETARLTTLAINIKIDGSTRAQWLQKQIDDIYFKLRDWVEYGCAFGTIVLKPNGQTIDIITPNDFMVVSQRNTKIDGMVFVNKAVSNDGKSFYTRLEYHRFLNDGIYAITNKCYKGANEDDITTEVDIESTPWSNLQEETWIKDIEKPLYAVLKTPSANHIEITSPLGLPIYAGALQELQDLDVAYSRNAEEILESRRIVLLDSDRLIDTGASVKGLNSNTFEAKRDRLDLPKYVRNVMGDGTTTFYEEINPSLNTEVRLSGINALLSQIGFKCGFSNGYFVFNEKTGMVTATQVESDDRRTIQFIKDMRDSLQSCLDDLIYALDKFADLYDLSPFGTYKVVYDFGDITYSYELDKQTWWSYVQAGKMPFWRYLVKFENFSEEEAKAIQSETEVQEENDLFDKE